MDLAFTMLVPVLIAGTALYGMFRRVDVYDALVAGALRMLRGQEEIRDYDTERND